MTVKNMVSRYRAVATVATLLASLLVAAPADPAHASVTYYLMQVRHSGMCATMYPSGFNGNTLLQGNCYNSPYTLFELSPTGDGHYRLVVQATSKCLDVTGASQTDRARVTQYSCHLGLNQQWELRHIDNGYYQIVARHSQKCLDVQGDYTHNGAYIWQYTCDAGDNQLFRFL